MIAELLLLRREVEELKRLIGNMIRTGTVEEVDPQKGYRLNFGTDEQGQPIKSPWYPHPESGGPLRTWFPLGKGQVMTAINPAGDSRQGFLVRGGFCDQFTPPAQATDQNVIAFGPYRITLTGALLLIEGGPVKIDGAFTTTKKTVLANGDTPVVFKGSLDTAGYANNQATAQVLIPGS